jgi:hypothetical protein
MSPEAIHLLIFCYILIGFCISVPFAWILASDKDLKGQEPMIGLLFIMAWAMWPFSIAIGVCGALGKLFRYLAVERRKP